MPRTPADGSRPAEIVYVKLDKVSAQQESRKVIACWKGTLLQREGLTDMMAGGAQGTPQPLDPSAEPWHLIEQYADGTIVVTTQAEDARGRRIRDPRRSEKHRPMTLAQAFKHGRRWAGRRFRFLRPCRDCGVGLADVPRWISRCDECRKTEGGVA
jgi:hypothetical protein